jgi:hypothetical protein
MKLNHFHYTSVSKDKVVVDTVFNFIPLVRNNHGKFKILGWYNLLISRNKLGW